jgi:hypothetical protein
MSEFEQKLRDALDPPPAPDGLTARIMGRIAASEAAPRHAGWKLWVAGLAAALILTLGISTDFQRAERIRGERAKQEVLMALRVAGLTLNAIEERVREIQPLRERSEEN